MNISTPTHDQKLAQLAQTMRDFSDTSGDHHMQAAHAIEQLRVKLHPQSTMTPELIETELSAFRDEVEEKVFDDDCQISLQWNLVAELAAQLTKEQLQNAFSAVMQDAKLSGLCDE